MSNQFISRLLSICAAASLLVACQPAALDEISDPNTQEPSVVPERTTIPYSLKVSTETTRAAYDEVTNSYSFKEGDKLQVKGLRDRTDIEGTLTQNGTEWSGTLSYLTSKDAPADNTQLEITLIHADNPHPETYGTALVGSASDETMSLLQYAVENYSLFKAQVAFGDHGGELSQQSAFLDVTADFIFDGTHEIEAGQALVDLIIGENTFLERTNFVPINDKDFQVHFIAVVPGGITTNDFALMVGDRAISFNQEYTLSKNNKYNVNRRIEYTPQLGDPFWSDGTYGRLQHPDSDASIVGIVVYVNHHYDSSNPKADIEDAITESASGYGHGLVMALRNVAQGVQWCPSSSTTILCTTEVEKPSETILPSNLSGFLNTNEIIADLGNSVVSAASRAKAYNVQVVTEKEVTVNGSTEVKKVSTGWFLPSIGQWIYSISTDGFGAADPAEQWTDNSNNPRSWFTNPNCNLDNLVRVMRNQGQSNNLLVDSLNNRLEKLSEEFGCEYDHFGIPKDDNSNVNYSDSYWTSSETSADKAIRMNFGSVEEDYATIKAKPESKTLTYFLNSSRYPARVRPFLAF